MALRFRFQSRRSLSGLWPRMRPQPTTTVIFGDLPEWWELIRERLDPARFVACSGDLAAADLEAAQLIAPLTHAEIRFLHRQPRHIRRRALLPPPDILALCEDKLVFCRRLRQMGFDAHLPRGLEREEIWRRRDDPTLFPFVVKKRITEWGLDSAMIANGADLERHAGWIGDDEYFCQSYVDGELDLTSHLVMHRGEAVYFSTFPFRLEANPCLRGRRGPATRLSLDHDPTHLPFFATLLAKIGFDEGICCFDYKLVEGRPVIFELNPRFGASLVYDAAPFLEAYAGAVRRKAWPVWLPPLK